MGIETNDSHTKKGCCYGDVYFFHNRFSNYFSCHLFALVFLRQSPDKVACQKALRPAPGAKCRNH